MELSGKMKPLDDRLNLLSPGTIQDLEELRQNVLHRLDSIEELARRRTGGPGAETSRLEQSFRQKIEDLEREKASLHEDVEREQRTWKQLLAQLENDRKLLTDAWQRLERERIEAIGIGGLSRTSPAGHAHRLPEGGSAHAAPAPPAHRATVCAEGGNPVAESILRQFQSLCEDVRRTSDVRSSPR